MAATKIAVTPDKVHATIAGHMLADSLFYIRQGSGFVSNQRQLVHKRMINIFEVYKTVSMRAGH